MNNIEVTGRLTKDPKIKYTATGVAVAKFRLAENLYNMHFFLGGGVLGIGFFLLGQQLGILDLQRFHGRELLQVQGVKGCLGRLVQQQDFRFMLGIVFLAVPSLAVGGVHVPRFGVVADLLLQRSNLVHASLGLLDRAGQRLKMCGSRRRFFGQLVVFQQALFL